ncbi:MAG TPA: mechanosensitive ion channel family protein [Clostridia bacterium]|nr:mechanosensitive ion channel family protein [Clostridia bacterium]
MQVDFVETWNALQRMANGFIGRLPYLAVAVVVFIAFYFLGRWTRRLVRHFAERRNRHQNLAIVLGRVAQAGAIILGILISLVIVLPSFRPSQLVEFLGIGSIAIGFAFRDILQNFLAGILLLVTEPFRIGDQIRFGEFEGQVENIQTRATFIRTYDGRRIVIPNANLFTNPVTVNTAFEQRRIEYDVGIGYGDNPEQAKRLILEAIRSVEDVLPEPAPDALVLELAPSAVKIRARWWITPPRRSDHLESTDRVLTAIKQKLLANGLDLPFPTQTVLFHDQTDEADGDRARQREGWPAGKGPRPGSCSIGGGLRDLAQTLRKRTINQRELGRRDSAETSTHSE